MPQQLAKFNGQRIYSGVSIFIWYWYYLRSQVLLLYYIIYIILIQV